MKQNMKPLLLGFLGVIVGIFLTLAVQQFLPKWREARITESTSPLTRQMQMWNDFHQSQRQMLEHFDRLIQGDLETDPFATSDPFRKFQSFGFSGKMIGVGELTQSEDDKFVYYHLEVEDLKSTSIQSKIENGALTVSGVVEKKDVSEGIEKSSKSQFQRTLPLPNQIDPKKMEVVSEGNRVTFKFPKV